MTYPSLPCKELALTGTTLETVKLSVVSALSGLAFMLYKRNF